MSDQLRVVRCTTEPLWCKRINTYIIAYYVCRHTRNGGGLENVVMRERKSVREGREKKIFMKIRMCVINRIIFLLYCNSII